MTFLSLQLRDKAVVLAFRRICMTKKKSSVTSGGKMPLMFGVHNVYASHARQMFEASDSARGTNNSLVFILPKVLF